MVSGGRILSICNVVIESFYSLSLQMLFYSIGNSYGIKKLRENAGSDLRRSYE